MPSEIQILTPKDRIIFLSIGIFCFAIAGILYYFFILKDDATYDNYKGSVYNVEQYDIYNEKSNGKKYTLSNKYTIVFDSSDHKTAPKSYKNVETYQKSILYNNPSPSPSETKASYIMLPGIILQDNKIDAQNNFVNIDENIDKEYNIYCKKDNQLNTQNCDVSLSSNDAKVVYSWLGITFLICFGSAFIGGSVPSIYESMADDAKRK